MNAQVDFENRATLARITCGRKKANVPLEVVRRYQRDVHSPAIARRAGLYAYRHNAFDPLRADLFAPVDGIGFDCPVDQQITSASDVRYLDDTGIAAFNASPSSAVKAHLLGDIDLIVERSTTYRTAGANMCTLHDVTGIPTPQGIPRTPTVAVFFRQRDNEAAFREELRRIASAWGRASGVLRVRLCLFEAPDIEAERKAGYPVKTQPRHEQYQGWIDLVLEDEGAARGLLAIDSLTSLGAHITAIHAYPVVALYTYVYGGRPTLVGLRGYAAFVAIQQLEASNQTQPDLLEWMYGPIAQGGPAEPPTS